MAILPQAKISGARFSVLSGQVARLERAIVQFFLDEHTCVVVVVVVVVVVFFSMHASARMMDRKAGGLNNVNRNPTSSPA